MNQASQHDVRIDARAKVTGCAEYTEDLPLPFGTLHCAILPSPYSHARIRSIDARVAERLPGVVAVLTRDHLDGLDPFRRSHGRRLGDAISVADPFFAVDKVRYDGEPVAAVAAETAAIAEAAVRLIEVEYEELPPVFDPEQCLAPDAPLLHEEAGTNLADEYVWSWGDVERGFRESDRIFEDRYTFPSVFHHPMENIGGCVAEVRGGGISLLAPIQHLFEARDEIAHLFGLDPDGVHVRTPFIGGGFGGKELKSAHLIAVWLARRTGRPVCTLPSAEESMRTDSRHQMVYDVKTGVKADGTLWAQEIHLLSNEGAYPRGLRVMRRAIGGAWGPYRIPHMRMVGRSVLTNRVPAGSFRSLGKAQVSWGYESNLDAIARAMGMPPLDLRLKNLMQRGDSIAEHASPLDADYGHLLESAAEAIGWDGRSASEHGAADGGERRRVRGRGLSTTFRHGYSGSDNSFATVTIDARGRVKISQTGVEIGMGVYNVLALVAARTLGVPLADIEVAHPDTNRPFSPGVASSRDTVCLGMAVQAACEDLKRELLDAAAGARGGRAEDWRLVEGKLWFGEQYATLAEIVRAMNPAGVLLGKGVHRTPVADNPFQGAVPYWESSAAAAEVEVDCETGEVSLLHYATACDVGKAIDPAACRGQLEGGAVMGLGDTFYEETVYGDQQFMNGDPFQYRLPLLRDMPARLETVLVENGDGPGPEGAKGMGQTGVSPVAPAIGNAICDAVGVRLHDLPITPEKVLRALGKVL
jgi:CO/xanthine dehydrogenase Mo-binding subunit